MEGVKPQFSPPETGMSVDPASQSRTGIIQVHPFQLVESDHPGKGTEGFFVSFLCPQVIPCGKDVTGIDTDSDSFWV